MESRQENTTFIALLLAFAIIGFGVLTTFYVESAQRRASELVHRTLDVENALNRLTILLLRGESGERGVYSFEG